MGIMSTGSIHPLDPDECRELLKVGRFGRIAFLRDGQLDLLPVNYAFDEDIVLFATAPGSGLASIVGRDFVLEVDHHDDIYQTGWSVVARGRASLAADEHLATFEARLPRSWAGGQSEDLHIAIDVEQISGRRVRLYPA